MATRPIMRLLDLLGRRWALRIGWELRDGEPVGFRELRARCGGMSPSVLSDRLSELAEAGVVERTDAGWLLTEGGRELVALLVPLNEWAERRLRR